MNIRDAASCSDIVGNLGGDGVLSEEHSKVAAIHLARLEKLPGPFSPTCATGLQTASCAPLPSPRRDYVY